MFSYAAGVFLIIRNSFIYEQIPNVLEIISLIGSLTCLFAATIGLLQNDIKKVIAYSTCSQLVRLHTFFISQSIFIFVSVKLVEVNSLYTLKLFSVLFCLKNK